MQWSGGLGFSALDAGGPLPLGPFSPTPSGEPIGPALGQPERPGLSSSPKPDPRLLPQAPLGPSPSPSPSPPPDPRNPLYESPELQ